MLRKLNLNLCTNFEGMDFPSEFKNWEIYGGFRDGMHCIHKRKDDKKYMCEILPKEMFIFSESYERKGYQFPKLPIIDTNYYKDKICIIYERIPTLKKAGNFNTKKIIEFILELARFQFYTQNYITLNFDSDLYVKNGELYIKSIINNHNRAFKGSDYLESIERLFKIFGEKEISEKIKNIKNTATEDKSFIYLKIKVLNCLNIPFNETEF